MASRRNLKKDINYITSELIAQAYVYLNLFGENNREEVLEILKETVTKRNEFIHLANTKTEKLSKKEVNTLFNNLYKDLLNSSYTLFGRIEALEI